ncbi:MAG: sugar transferase [Ruminococcus sp.]|nr:sugar transferase [Ruminococcus sp.]MCR5730806.1 sugar transferase [Ruminococcus sp.]
MAEQAKGNYNLISSEEGEIAKYLKEKNLRHTNEISQEVHPVDSFYTRYVKRILDILISLPVFLLTFPFNLIFGICTYFDVGSPIFYHQTRAGKDLKEIDMIKFRNMTNATDENGKLLPAKDRVTKFGRFMRKTSLDELLNFWSVLKGDMSIIGPRPLPLFFTERMSERHKARYAVRPGLECPRMVPQDNPDKSIYHYHFESDIWYVEHVSFKTDVMLVFKLIKMTLSFRKRAKNANVASYFVGYDDEGYATSTTHAKKVYGEDFWKKSTVTQD